VGVGNCHDINICIFFNSYCFILYVLSFINILQCNSILREVDVRGGSTTLALLRTPSVVYACNVGDCRCVLIREVME
jgi:hypothetical protein